MTILWGFLNIIVGVFFIWMGAFQMITAMLPKEIGMMVAERHGAWMRENVFNLPPIDDRKHTEGVGNE